MQNTQKYKFYFSTESIKTLKSKKIKFLLIQYIPAIAVCIYLYFNTDLKTVLFLGILGLITALVFWYYHFSNLLEKIELIITENNLTISGSKRFKLDVNIIIDKNTKISKTKDGIIINNDFLIPNHFENIEKIESIISTSGHLENWKSQYQQ